MTMVMHVSNKIQPNNVYLKPNRIPNLEAHVIKKDLMKIKIRGMQVPSMECHKVLAFALDQQRSLNQQVKRPLLSNK